MKCSIEPQRQWLNSKQYFILNVRLQMPKHLTINHFRSHFKCSDDDLYCIVVVLVDLVEF